MNGYVYFYRILDRYRKEIAAIAIFADNNKNFKPSSFRYEFFDTKLVYKYRTYKILESSSEELMNSSNPFALVVLAARNAINAKNNEGRKLKFRNGDELTSPGRHTDLGQVCSI